MKVLPPIVDDSTEKAINGSTDLPNMTMDWDDNINYSRNIYIAGTLNCTGSPTLTIFFRINTGGGTIARADIVLGPTVQVNIPIFINISYIVLHPYGIYPPGTGEYVSTTTVIVNEKPFMFYGQQNTILHGGVGPFVVSAQWTSPYITGNSLKITDFIVTNNYVS